MASYALNDVLERLQSAGHNQRLVAYVEKLLDKNLAPQSQLPQSARSVRDLVNKLHNYPISLLVKNHDDVTTLAVTASDGQLVDTIRDLTSILEDDSDNTNKALAIVILTLIFGMGKNEPTASDLYASGKYRYVFNSLIAASNTANQHWNVGACQVYDFAAWALRAIFLGRGTEELKLLPLPAVRTSE